MNRNLIIRILKAKIQYSLAGEGTLTSFPLEILAVEIWLCKTELSYVPCLKYNEFKSLNEFALSFATTFCLWKGA